MFAQSLRQFHILQPGPANPFSLPVRQISNVMRYTPDMAPEHRIRIHGVVTANRNGNLLSVSDATHGLFVRTVQARDLNVGDLIDVVGFAAMGEYTPVLQDVVYRKLGSALLPTPVPLSAEEVFSGSADAELVHIRGRLLRHTRNLQERTFLVASGERTVSAVLPANRASESMDSLRDGSLIEFTGICMVEVYPNKTPKSVQILLRSPQDVVVLQQSSWWTATHALVALGALATGVVAAFGWITLLFHRMRAQGEALRKAKEQAAAISDLAHAMQEVAMDRKFTARVSAGGNDGLAQLGVSFNRMLDELEDGERAKRQAEAKLQEQA